MWINVPSLLDTVKQEEAFPCRRRSEATVDSLPNPFGTHVPSGTLPRSPTRRKTTPACARGRLTSPASVWCDTSLPFFPACLSSTWRTCTCPVHSAARCPLPSAETEGVPPRRRKSVHSAESGNNLSAPGQASAIEGDMESQVSQGRLNKGCVNHGNMWRTAILTSLFFSLFFLTELSFCRLFVSFSPGAVGILWFYAT